MLHRKQLSVMTWAIGLSSSLIIVAGSAVAGPGVNEDDGGDAGGSLGTALDLTGSGQLLQITGSLGSADRQDIFKLKLESGANWGFGLTLNGSPLASSTFQSALWLFNSDGEGVLANTISPNPEYLSLLAPSLVEGGSTSLAAGDYYLAITEQGDEPFSTESLSMFDFGGFPEDAVVGPVDPSLRFEDSWAGTTGTGGSYSINIQPYPIPAPATLALLGLAGLIGGRRRR
ncbi:MAG: DVUA0089 family protein [Phycisphaerales bacterium]|nr:DVUA0089 family protein [Phycisphaerales bacterium]